MTKLGYIEITDKVRFVYYELEKPDLDNFKKHPVWAYAEYDKAMKAYKVSKRTVEVSNVVEDAKYKKWFYISMGQKCGFEWDDVINEQKCKAKVNETAEIIELIK